MEGPHLTHGPNKSACDPSGSPHPKRFRVPELSAINRSLSSQHQRASPPLLMSSEGHRSSGAVALGSPDPPLGFPGLTPLSLPDMLRDSSPGWDRRPQFHTGQTPPSLQG